MNTLTNRRDFIQTGTGLLATISSPATAADSSRIEIDPAPAFDLSPHLYMQFMEPLGTTDSSVEAAWDHDAKDWRADVVAATADLAPTMMRWGGIFTDYYRWREGVGPRNRRVPMRNILWGGYESNQVGTAEFVDFSRRVGADPLVCVNFESDGRPNFMEVDGSRRVGDAREAAEWVAYCNDPDNAERKGHGFAAPLRVPYWQIGNETSYARQGFDLNTAKRKTVEFARAMRQADPSIKLIGWGGRDWRQRELGDKAPQWAKGMIEAAGDLLDYVAFHHMFNPDSAEEPVLAFGKFRQDPARSWDQLMGAWKAHDEKIRWAREQVAGTAMPLAMTECHYAIPGRHRCEVLSTWACGVSYARLLNLHERHGDVLKIATAADFCGTRWQVNAVMIPVPKSAGRAFLMPVAHVMRLYRKHTGAQALKVFRSPDGLDVTASRTGEKIFLHVANANRTRGVSAVISVPGRALSGGKAWEIAADPMLEILGNDPGVLAPKEKAVPPDGRWTFPPASVTALEVGLT